MSTPDTTPRAQVGQAIEAEGTAAVLILAGYALLPLPLDRPRVLVVTDDFEFGRNRANEAWLASPEDPLMSRRHACISRLSNGEYTISDLGSTNGTWLDGRCVPVGAALK